MDWPLGFETLLKLDGGKTSFGCVAGGDGEVGNYGGMLAAERGELGKRANQRFSKGDEWFSGLWCQVGCGRKATEAAQLELKWRERAEYGLNLADDRAGDLVRRYERGEHGDVRGYANVNGSVEAVAQLADARFSRGNQHNEGGLGHLVDG